MEKIACDHQNLEKMNDNIYICHNCSLIRMIKYKNNKQNNENTKLLLSKSNYYYNIKNEINIFHLTKNIIDEKNDYYPHNKEKSEIFQKNKTLYLKFRNKLINHIHNLCSEINSTYDCFYLSILLLDILIHKLNYIISNYQLDLFSTICFIISKKFIEKDKMKAEKYNQYLTICHSPQKFINSKDLILSEIECLKLLKYNINIPTSFTIMKYMFICGIIFEEEISIKEYSKINEECLNLLLFCNNNNEIAFYYNPVLIVFSIIYIIRKKYKFKFMDTLDLFSLFDIKFNQIKECVKLISKLYFNNNYLKSNNYIEKNINIKRSLSQNKKYSNKSNKRFYTPSKCLNFNYDENYYIMRIRDYKYEKNINKEDDQFFRCFIRKRKLYDIGNKNSGANTNNINYSINGNVILDNNENICRNI